MRNYLISRGYSGCVRHPGRIHLEVISTRNNKTYRIQIGKLKETLLIKNFPGVSYQINKKCRLLHPPSMRNNEPFSL